MTYRLRAARNQIRAKLKYCGEPTVELPLNIVMVDQIAGMEPRLLIGMADLIKIIDAIIGDGEGLYKAGEV